MKIQAKHLLNLFFSGIVNIVFWGSMLFLTWIFIQIFFVSSFKIPSDSMEPELINGDNILVNKWILGPRLFNAYTLIKGKQVPIKRLPGIRSVKRNDVLVFNFPHPKDWNKIEMDFMKYYIKRCIAIPGDSLFIKNGFYHLKNSEEAIGIYDAQLLLSRRENETIPENVFRTFPFDSTIQWNIKDFGPLYIPRKGDRIALNRHTATLYCKLIEWEQKKKVNIQEDKVYIDNQLTTHYEFLTNYYFMAGDKIENSQDSRYWGLLPEPYIVGKAWIIWYSIDKNRNKTRWNRLFKTIH